MLADECLQRYEVTDFWIFSVGIHTFC